MLVHFNCDSQSKNIFIPPSIGLISILRSARFTIIIVVASAASADYLTGRCGESTRRVGGGGVIARRLEQAGKGRG